MTEDAAAAVAVAAPAPVPPATSPAPSVGRLEWFPYLIAVALISFCLIVRGVLHVPLRPDSGGSAEARSSTTALADPADNLSYAAWAQECRQGQFRMNSLYTVDPHPAALFNPYFALVGLISRVAGVHVLLVMNLLGLMAAGVAIVVIYQVALAIGVSRLAARWATLFLAFGSGLSAAQHILAPIILGRRLVNGADVVFLDAIGHSTFVVFPYHSFALALAAMVTWMVALALRQTRAGEPPPPRRSRYMFAATVLTLVLSWVHPYEILLPLAAMVIWTVLGEIFVDPQDTARRARIILCLLLCAAAAPQVLYGIYVNSLPVWGEMLQIARELPISSRQWIIGFGLLLLLAIVGCRQILLRGMWSDAGGWLLCWFAAVVILLIGLQISFTKLSDGASIMMCLLAGAGVACLWQSTPTNWPLRIGLALLLILPFTTPILLLQMYGAYAQGMGRMSANYDPEIAALLGDPNRVSPERLDVLCDARTGLYLPGFYGYRVFAGYVALTPDFQSKATTLASAGVTPPMPPATQPGADQSDRPLASPETFNRLLADHKWDRVLLAKKSEAAVFMRDQPGWRQIGQTSRYLLFARG